MTNPMADLIVFLRARLDDDAAAARAATAGPWWHNPGKQWLDDEAFKSYDLSKGQEFVGYGGPHPFTGAVASTGPASHMQSMKDASHIARHDPARVLAEVDAKRKVVNAYERAVAEFQDSGPAMISYDRLTGSVSSLRTALEFLALPYADHPNYDTSWRP